MDNEALDIHRYGIINDTYDKCPDCKVFKGQYHHPNCKVKNEQLKKEESQWEEQA